MKMQTFRVVGLSVALALSVVGSAEARPNYIRSQNWMAGTTQGGTVNNPSSVNGTPTWQYEVVQGGPLGSVNPWYSQSSQLMTWDGQWYATGLGVWSNGNDANPPVFPSRLVHNVHASVFGDIPVVRWRNPLGNNATAGITGTLQVNWNGVQGLGRPTDVDVIIGKYTASSNSVTLLYQNTVSKPLPFPSVGDSVNLPINLSNIALNDGDSIITSLRGRTSMDPLGAWINLYDNLTVSAVPAPGSLGLLGVAGLIAARRRRS